MNSRSLKLSRFLAVLAFSATAGLLLPSAASAQSSGGTPPPAGGHWMGRGLWHGGWGPRGGAKVVTGEPYTAQAVTSTVETLSNGASITRQITAQIARDNEGRTMRSQTFNGFGASGSQSGATIVSIFDPVANQRIEYNTATKKARVFNLPQPSGSSSPNSSPNHGKHFGNGPGTVQTESLGTQTIAGVSAQGTRTVRTIPAGAIGNNQPIQVTAERWYSPDLQIVVQSSRNDPRFGQTTYTLSNLHTGEPNASLFQVPQGYQIKTIDVPSHNAVQ